MKSRAACLAFIAIGCCVVARGDDQRIDDIVAQIAEEEHHPSFLYRTLFEAAGPDGLSKLHSHADDSIAIQSAWESVTLTVPVEFGHRVYRPDADKLHWFVGFIEGRARVTPPEWWVEMVIDARANQRDNIYPGESSEYPYHSQGFVFCPIDDVVDESEMTVAYRGGENEVQLPEEILQRTSEGELFMGLSACFTDDKCFVATHGNAGYAHEVVCIDCNTNELLWESRACGCFTGFATGYHESCVAVIATDDDRVFVFGVASVGFYVHGFKASTGESILRFSNNY